MIINKSRIREGRFYYVGYGEKYYMLLDIKISSYEKFFGRIGWKYTINKYLGTWRGDLKLVGTDKNYKAHVVVNFNYDKLDTKYGCYDFSLFEDYDGNVWSLPRSQYEDIVEKQREEEKLRKKREEEKMPENQRIVSESARRLTEASMEKWEQEELKKIVEQHTDEEMATAEQRFRTHEITLDEYLQEVSAWKRRLKKKGVYFPSLYS